MRQIHFALVLFLGRTSVMAVPTSGMSNIRESKGTSILSSREFEVDPGEGDHKADTEHDHC
jgi:hypothetical protein